jgi:hypothetical protein
MKHNSTKQSLARKVALKIVNKNSKVNANTRIASDQSKIVPKNTNDSLEMPQGIEKR